MRHRKTAAAVAVLGAGFLLLGTLPAEGRSSECSRKHGLERLEQRVDAFFVKGQFAVFRHGPSSRYPGGKSYGA